MLTFSHSIREVEVLSRIVNEIKPSSDSIDQMDQLTIRVNEVIPFDRCVILHERERRVSKGFVYRNCCSIERSSGRPGRSFCGAALGVEQYMACFATSNRVHHVFHWRDAGRMPADAHPRVAELATHMRGAQGVAASVRSVADCEGAATLLQFECADKSMRHMLLLSFIAFYLHSTLTEPAVELRPQGEFKSISLTGKERDVLRWVVEGKTSWEIGRILSTSERTVKFHLKNVYTKLNVSNRAQAVAVVNRLQLM